MRIPKALVDEMIAHSEEDAPNECCGLIGGVGDEARSLHRARVRSGIWRSTTFTSMGSRLALVSR